MDDPCRAAAEPSAYDVVRTARRTLEVRVLPGGRVEVRAPLRLPDSAVRRFVDEKAAWIERARSRAPAERPQREYRVGELFRYLGQSYPLRIVEGALARLRLTDAFELSAGHADRARSVFEDWYRVRARQELASRVGALTDRVGARPRATRLSSARWRWGSCSRKGVVRLNWRLVMAPGWVIDYVIVHELAHLRHLDHSRRFWGVVEETMPNYRDAVQWLRGHGHELAL
ncbi:MAG: hypothetical protein MOGMAGMI_01263 [Candidatus Omnitrophica bacterium]|nr:hypothetical protein [Candidatus Omnitrophota bacterium]